MASKEQPGKALAARKAPRVDDARLHALRQAIAHTPHQDRETRQALHMALAEALALATQDPRRAADKDALTLERAHVLFHAQEYEGAGRLFEALGRLALAERCYRQAGAIDALEAIYDRQARAREFQQHRAAFVAKLDEAFAAGRRKLVIEQSESILQDPKLRSQAAGLLGQLQSRSQQIRSRNHAKRRASLRYLPQAPNATRVELFLHFAPEFSLGRSPQADLMCPDESLSREHAALRIDQAQVELCDLGSKTGTFLDGDALMPEEHCELFTGEVHQIGLGLSTLVHAQVLPGPCVLVWHEQRPQSLHLVGPPPLPWMQPSFEEDAPALAREGLSWSVDPQHGLLTLSRSLSATFTLLLNGQLVDHQDPIELLTSDKLSVRGPECSCQIELF